MTIQQIFYHNLIKKKHNSFEYLNEDVFLERKNKHKQVIYDCEICQRVFVKYLFWLRGGLPFLEARLERGNTFSKSQFREGSKGEGVGSQTDWGQEIGNRQIDFATHIIFTYNLISFSINCDGV